MPIRAIPGLAAVSLILATGGALAQGQGDTERYVYGPHMGWWDGGWYGMAFGPVFMVLVLAVVIALAALLVRWIGGSWHHPAHAHHEPPRRGPIDILKERFARGEIDKEEFEERRRVLGD